MIITMIKSLIIYSLILFFEQNDSKYQIDHVIVENSYFIFRKYEVEFSIANHTIFHYTSVNSLYIC